VSRPEPWRLHSRQESARRLLDRGLQVYVAGVRVVYAWPGERVLCEAETRATVRWGRGQVTAVDNDSARNARD